MTVIEDYRKTMQCPSLKYDYLTLESVTSPRLQSSLSFEYSKCAFYTFQPESEAELRNQAQPNELRQKVLLLYLGVLEC